MMSSKTAVIFLLIGLQWLVTASQDLASTIYVLTDEQHCPTEQSCYTFSDLVTFSATHNFSLNTTILISSGYHSISTENDAIIEILLIQDLDYFKIASFKNQPDSNATKCLIRCASPLTFEFRNVTSLKISGITLEYCGSVQKFSSLTFNVTVLVINSTSFDMSYVTITNTKGVGLLIQNVRQNLSISNVRLSHNEVNCYIQYASNSFDMNSTAYNYLITNSTFSYSDAAKLANIRNIGASGLHIRMEKVTGTLEIINNTLYKNKGYLRNIFLDFKTHNLLRLTKVTIKQLISIPPRNYSPTHRVFVLRCAPRNSCFNVYAYIEDSSFEKGCITIYGTEVARFKNVAVDRSECFTSINLYWTPNVYFDNLNITFGKHAIKLSNSRALVRNQLYIYHNKGGIRLERSTLLFEVKSRAYFTENIVTEIQSDYSSVLYAKDSEITIGTDSIIEFKNNTSTLGGAITAVASDIILLGPNLTLTFKNNKGTNGGAIAMYDSSQISLISNRHVKLMFIENVAIQKGGAIYVDTASYIEKRNRNIKKVVKFETVVQAGQCPTVQYKNNTATIAGNDIYGGWIDSNSGLGRWGCNFLARYNTNNALLSSDPVRVCICNNHSVPDCNITDYTIEVYPGESFEIKAVAVGWRFGTVPAIVQARFEPANDQSRISQYVQITNRNCTHLSYKLRSANKHEKIHLYVDKTNIPKGIVPNTSLLSKDLFLNAVVKTCAPGFLFNASLSVCICHPFLAKYKTECNTELFKVIRSGQAWITANEEHVLTISQYCPYDYCKSSSDLELLDLEYPDQQCSFSRLEVLCGRCQANLSHVFGTSKCKECSNLWVLLIIPVFILAGITLVAFVMVLNLTVSIGTINGLIFYANIVRANQAVFFPPETANSFLSWFFAWINLDFGIEVCFYDGLDAYAKTWFQFLFPLYIWFIVITIIVLSRHFDTIAKLFGNNAVPVLATLFLFSYAKLLRVIITIFQPSQLDFSDGNSTRAWLYDGNINYLKGKHIPLFMVALAMLLFLSFPYTAVLLTIQWLQKVNQYRIFFWVNRLKPLLDAYAGPYKDKHRYWTGLLLLDRVILFLIFSLNVSNNPSVNLLAIIVTQILIFSHSFLVGRVYKSWLTNAIELSFHINISLLAATTLFQISTSLSPKLSTNILASIAFIMFVIISIVHLVQRVVKHRFPQHKDIFANLKERFAPKKDTNENEDETTAGATDGEGSGVSTTFVELREPLID